MKKYIVYCREKLMGITEDDREVKLTFENGKIVIEKKNNECVANGHLTFVPRDKNINFMI